MAKPKDTFLQSKGLSFIKQPDSLQYEIMTKYERIPTNIYSSSKDASKAIANEVAALIKIKQLEGKSCILGLPTGSTPIEVYTELVRLHKEEKLSFSNVVTFNLDEYYPMQPAAQQSYVRFMHERLFKHVDIKPENINIPDGTVPKEKVLEFCRQYEEKIHAYGGIDLQLLGIGRTGHIGFNEPGSQINSSTRLITLDHVTRRDAAADFFGLEKVPRRAITMGIGSIMQAKRVILMAWSEDKAKIIQRAIEGQVSDKVPASFLQDHTNVTFVIDRDAAAELTRVKTPWLLDTCDWDDRLIRKSVVWLCQKLKKPILKLTDRDYNDNGMGDLVAEHGPAYNINIRVFNELQHTITGWPGGKPNADDTHRPERAKPAQKRVIVFSPHPDDDVISMGGTLIRLVDQKHHVHVAYQVSGNIAVSDDAAFRFIDSVREYQQTYEPDNNKIVKQYDKIRKFLKNKKASDIDLPEIRKIKGIIRRGEAKSACRYVGIKSENMHFLDLPFYETGAVKKKPLAQEDIQITVDLLRKIKPHQIYAAGDLSDPHGTHRVCLDAIFAALEIVKNDEWLKDCYVWLYRGAWQEWDIDEVEMAVPISPEELMRKRTAIFKHQSQKDNVMFPGSDQREFWERAEARNRATAILYDELGMAEYEAIEAFVRYLPKNKTIF